MSKKYIGTHDFTNADLVDPKRIEKETTGSISVANNIWVGTEAEYTALVTKNATILYFRTA